MFFCRQPAHQDLHSFPTRRSSDLPAVKPTSANTNIPHGKVPSQRSISQPRPAPTRTDRKSTRLNSSHVENSYVVFCLQIHSRQNKRQCRQLTPQRKYTG